MDKLFHYKVINISESETKDGLDEILNEAGFKGWELCGVYGVNLIFKYQVTIDPDVKFEKLSDEQFEKIHKLK